jgi:hypothetical protein
VVLRARQLPVAAGAEEPAQFLRLGDAVAGPLEHRPGPVEPLQDLDGAGRLLRGERRGLLAEEVQHLQQPLAAAVEQLAELPQVGARDLGLRRRALHRLGPPVQVVPLTAGVPGEGELDVRAAAPEPGRGGEAGAPSERQQRGDRVQEPEPLVDVQPARTRDRHRSFEQHRRRDHGPLEPALALQVAFELLGGVPGDLHAVRVEAAGAEALDGARQLPVRHGRLGELRVREAAVQGLGDRPPGPVGVPRPGLHRHADVAVVVVLDLAQGDPGQRLLAGLLRRRVAQRVPVEDRGIVAGRERARALQDRVVLEAARRLAVARPARGHLRHAATPLLTTALTTARSGSAPAT